MRHHPVQPDGVNADLPFNANKVYKRTLPDNTTEPRKWLSFCSETSKVYCSICMVFSTERDNNLIEGVVVDRKQLNKQLQRHENLPAHGSAAESFLHLVKRKDIETLMNQNMVTKRKTDIEIRRQVVRRIIDIIVYIGRQGLAYRANVEEAAADIRNKHVNHGNFLELVLLVAEYDQILKNHVEQAIRKSQERRERNPESKGRGGLVTFLSKTFINKLIKYLAIQIQLDIASEIHQAGIFSIEVDSTQDIAVMDQLALCVRYVHNGHVRVRLLTLSVAQKTTGEALYLQIKEELGKFKLSTAHIVGCSFDGAANMSGQYNGVQALLRKDNPSLLYVHCYAHTLNLVMTDSTESCKAAKDFLGLLQTTAVFISESHKRMLVWTKVNSESAEGQQLLRRLQKVNSTRWWSKDRALHSIFDDLNVPLVECKKFISLLVCLFTIANSDDFASDVVFKAKSLLDNWCKFESILIAFVYRDLFNVTTPTSNYLQTSGLDYLTAGRMINTLHSHLLAKRNGFDSLHKSATAFVENLQNRLDENDVDILIEKTLSVKRIPKAKKRADELATDESRQIQADPYKRFEISVFNVIIDTAHQQLSRRFHFNEELMTDIAMLDPRNFVKMKDFDASRDDQTLSQLAKLSGTNHADLQRELCQFASHFNDYYPVEQVASSSTSAQEQSSACDSDNSEHHCEMLFSQCNPNVKCKRCLICALELLHELNSHCSLYTCLYLAYKFALTLSCTQVSCERVFSVLKVIKNRLRSSLSQDLLEDFVLLSVDRGFNFDYDKVIDGVASSSKELARLLKL